MKAAAITVAVALCVGVGSTRAGSIPIGWSPVPGAEGYRVHYGPAPGAYTSSSDVGSTTTAAVSVADCSDWHLAVTSYGPAGESVAYSNEVSGWPRPRVTMVSPLGASQGSQYVLDVHGANFQIGSDVVLRGVPLDARGEPLVRVESVQALSCQHLQALLTVEPLARGLRAAPVGDLPLAFEVRSPESVFGNQLVHFSIAFDADRWDIDRNSASVNRVDGYDLAALAAAFGSGEGDPNFHPDTDLDGSGRIDGGDLAHFAQGFGRCRVGGVWLSCDAE